MVRVVRHHALDYTGSEVVAPALDLGPRLLPVPDDAPRQWIRLPMSCSRTPTAAHRGRSIAACWRLFQLMATERTAWLRLRALLAAERNAAEVHRVPALCDEQRPLLEASDCCGRRLRLR